MADGIPARLTRTDGRKFALTVGGAFLLLAVLLAMGNRRGAWVLAGIGGLLSLAGLVAPERLGPVSRGWMRLALLISKVTTPILLLVVYFLVMMPIGIIARLLGRNPIRHRAAGGSYWVRRSDARGNMTNQF